MKLTLAMTCGLVLGSSVAAQTFRAPVQVTSAGFAASPTLPADELTMYVSSGFPGRYVQDVGMTTRASSSAPWGPVVRVAALSTDDHDGFIEVRDDHLEMLVTRVGNYGPLGVWSYTRASPTAPWGAATRVTQLSFQDNDRTTLTGDGLEIFLGRASPPANTGSIYRSTRASLNGPWTTPTLVAELETPAIEAIPAISGDGLTIVFISSRPGGVGLTGGMWIATRPDRSSPFGTPIPLTAVNGAGVDIVGGLSADGFSLYFASDRLGPPGGGPPEVFRADRMVCACYPENGVPPQIGQTFDIYVRRDPADAGQVGAVFGAATRLPVPVAIPGITGAFEVDPATTFWQGVGTLNADGKYTTRIRIPEMPQLRGLDLHFQGASQDATNAWYLSRSVLTTIE